ncbi:MAG: carboxypeptidase-like regulatory domain-containing protein [Promethearchaeota archaeon]|jgi:hypothetical protein
MSNRKRIYSLISIWTFIFAFLIISSLVPVFFGNLKNYPITNTTSSDNILRSSEFTKDNYSATLTKENQGLGTITIDDMHFNGPMIRIQGIENHSGVYPLLESDLFSFALDANVSSVEFMETTHPAIYDNLNDTQKLSITFKLNEIIIVSYNNPQEGYLIYYSHFGPILREFYVDDGSSVVKLNEGTDYIIDSLGYLVFYYEDYFNKGPTFTFKMYLIWEDDFALESWALDQSEETPLIMSESEQEFTVRFTYKFFLVGYRVLLDFSGTVPIDYIDVALTIHPPDKELLSYQALNINAFDKNVNDYVNPDKSLSIVISDLFTPNGSVMLLNFTCSFGLKFEEPVGDSWGIDRLIAGRNIRERIYFISMVTGPPHIFLKNVALYQRGIYIDQVVKVSSLFNREVQYFDANASVPRLSGLKLNMPYLIFGETCPFTIKYIALQTLSIVVTDTIKMPLIGATIEILLFGVKYGTYISNKTSQPINPGLTDQNGQIVLYDVPHGNYTVRVLWQGEVVTEATVTTDKEVNYVFTSIPHFPLWILIFGITSGIILAVGALFYLKYKKLH